MLRYTRGYIKNLIPGKRTLVIELSNCKNNCSDCKNKARQQEDGNPLNKEILKIILESYKKYINVVCFVGGEEDLQSLKEVCKSFHKENIEVCFSTACFNTSTINKIIFDEIDYFISGRCDQEHPVLKKDYCPFADATDWIEIKNTNISQEILL